MTRLRTGAPPPEARARLEHWLDEEWHTARHLPFTSLHAVIVDRIGYRFAPHELCRALRRAEERHAGETEAREWWVAQGTGPWPAFLKDWQAEHGNGRRAGAVKRRHGR